MDNSGYKINLHALAFLAKCLADENRLRILPGFRKKTASGKGKGVKLALHAPPEEDFARD